MSISISLLTERPFAAEITLNFSITALSTRRG
nr:MAG TPA: hypothetical protein [Caudoviricetes sp.]